jgi:aspartyl-tRNA(Asn)/glutamyl-tRNA(Gln) amidotransferase subunit B
VKLNEKYEPVIGLEVHAQMLTQSKAFCSCPTTFGNEPNTNVCPVCLGLPGTLPVVNVNLVEFVTRLGLATGCTITPKSVFARKNYFYPDLPKGYQISQFEEPMCTNGFLEIEEGNGTRKRIGITRIHMEEDAGKSIHDRGVDTFVDVNRTGVPLVEIVSEPDIRSPREAYLYMVRMHQLVTYLGICDGNMEEGSLRCDANVSVRKKGEEGFGTKTEVKNMNSFRYVERALEFEINRQIHVMENGESVVQETLLWDAHLNAAVPMRSKEESHDYRYFPEPDLVPVCVDEGWIARVRAGLPELPTERRDRYMKELGLPKYDADVLTASRATADYFEEALRHLCAINGQSSPENAKSVSNWVMTDVLRVVGTQKADLRNFVVSPRNLAAMIGLVHEGAISGTMARDVFNEMVQSGLDPRAIIDSKGLVQVSDPSAIEEAVRTVLSSYPQQVEKYLGGNVKVFGFFVGETMKAMKGKANPGIVNDVLRKRLSGLKR